MGYSELLSSCVIVHTFVGYLLLSDHFLSPFVQQLASSLKDSKGLYIVFQVAVYMLNLILVVCLFGAKKKYKTHIWFSTVKRVLSLYCILTKMSIFLTSMLLYLKWE